jgi:dehydrogenase/reductase SDR family protein X
MSFRLSDPLNRQGEYAIITGGNRGIGFYTLLGLQASGMKVIAGKQIYCQNGRQLFKHR